MRLVEVVMLMGAHCVSPVEHSQMMTDAAKVQCAVVIEKDTVRGTMTVTPQEAAGDPQVMAALERFRTAPADALTGGGTKIVPAWAPAGSSPVEIKPPVAKVTVAPEPIAPSSAISGTLDASTTANPPVEQAPAAGAQAAPEPEAQPAPAPRKVATLAPPPPKQSPVKAPAAKKQDTPAKASPAAASKPGGSCKGAAVAKWYKTSDGKRKYRCVKPASDAAPDQLY